MNKKALVFLLIHLDEYNRMTEVEFLEFIVRMAHTLYKDLPNKSLEELVDLLLMKLLGLVKTLKFPPYEPEDQTEDDDEVNPN